MSAELTVAVAHNYYVSSTPSGENMVVDDEMAGLERRGVAVHPYTYSSDDALAASSSPIRLPSLAVKPIYSREGTSKFRAFCREYAPSVVHVHNVFPYLSPYIVRTARALGIPVVQTLHNYRRECVKGTFSRDGEVCVKCSGLRIPTPAIRHSCYRFSRLQTVPMATSLAVHRGTWKLIDRHIVLSAFQKMWLIRQGIDEKDIVVRPTCVSDPGYTSPEGKRLVFVGRADPEKGADILIDTWLRSSLKDDGWILDIVGDGPSLPRMIERCGRAVSVVFHGRKSPDEVGRIVDDGSAVIVPSLTFEGFPRVISEAFARARPVLAIRNENLESIICDAGWVASSGEELVRVMNGLRNSEDVEIRSSEARRRFEEELSENVSYGRLINIYRELACV